MKEKGTPAIEDRKQRMVLANKILVAKKKISYRKGIALVSYNLGISERKAKEYIDTLLMVNGIDRVGDLIVRRKEK